MNTGDGRALGREALEERRQTIIRMKLKGYCTKEITEITGCSRITVYLLWREWRKTKNKKEKSEVVQVKKPGRKTGYGRTLSAEQEKTIQKAIIDKYPDQLKFDSALWTREGVRQLIQKLFGIVMPIRTVGEYLKRWNFTPQKPKKYAYERDETKVKEWLEKEYPRIKTRAKRQKADIFWGDETGLYTTDVRGRGYAPQGKTPVVKQQGKKEKASMISAITNQGKIHWKIYAGSINSEKFLEFVKQLVKHKRKKVFLIVDNAKTHHSLILKEWLLKNKKKIELYYLPPYSPDLNPDEHVNSDVKYGVGSRAPKESKKSMITAAEEHMLLLLHSPQRIIKYFKDPFINYAA
jgi:transposase